MTSLAVLALAASLLAGCNQKKDPPPAPAPAAAPNAGSPAQPPVPAPAPAPAPAPTAPSTPTPAPAQAPKEAAGPKVSSADAIRRLAQLADKICACADRACAEATYTAFQDENRSLATRLSAPPTPAEAAAMQGQAQRFSGCLQRLK
jgi:hypothetical protein